MEEHIAQTHSENRRSRMEKVAGAFLMIVTFLIPIFFLPQSVMTLIFSKMFVIYIGILVAFILFLLATLEKGKLTLPVNLLFLFSLLIPVAFLVSALFGTSVNMGVFGYGFEIGTFAFMLAMFVLLYLTSVLYKTKEKIFYSYLLFFISFGLIALFQIIKLFSPASLTLGGIFSSAQSNTIGGWNDLGIFFGAATILALVTLEMLALSKFFRTLIYIALIVSLIFLMIVNFGTLWIVLAVFSFIFFVYQFLSNRFGGEQHARSISYNSLVVLIISLIFIFAGSFIGQGIANKLNISNVEVRPSWGTTWSIARSTLTEHALFGSGPNTFTLDWVKYKPAAINSSAFWNTDFNYGIGLLPTFFVTTGIVGLVAWFGFLILYFLLGLRAIFSRIGNQLERFLIISSFMVSLFLWILTIVYVPSAVMVALTFFFTGLFIASAYSMDMLKVRTITLYENAKTGFVVVLATVFALLISGIGGFYIMKNFVSGMYFQKGITLAQTADGFPKAESIIQTAITLSKNDLYYRTLSQFYMAKINQILQEKDKPVETLRTEFQLALSNAITSAQSAVAAGPEDYNNQLALGQIYEAVVPDPFKIDGAYEKAHEAYIKALALNPTSPQINLFLARLEVAHNNLKGSEDYIGKAIEQKPNYADAYFLLSQVQVSEGDIPKAIKSVEATTQLAPNNAGLYFQLGLLKYNQKDWQGAGQAFANAVGLVPDYANAKYFLGLVYQKIGNTTEAIHQFQDLAKSNPDNKEVKAILSNLTAGKEPFANVAPPLDNKPEKRENPPIKDKTTTTAQ